MPLIVDGIIAKTMMRQDEDTDGIGEVGGRDERGNASSDAADRFAERRYYLILGALTLLLASAPYLYAMGTTPRGYVFTGLLYNIDDSCVYLSWMQQAQAGHFFVHSLFSTEPQRGVLFNLFFWALGTLVRLTHLPPIAVYHGARVVCGGLFLAAVVRLLREALPTESDARARRLGFALVCVGAGLGWLWGGYAPAQATRQPVDLWQPEAISFLSLYFSPLFAAALALMVVFMTAALRVERTRRLRDAVPAMIAGALLGNFHSYDVIPLFTVWFVYRLLSDLLLAHRFDVRAWLPPIVVGLAALPTTAYVFWATQVEPVFHSRAFVSATWSPAIWWDLLGLGLPLALAISSFFLPRSQVSEGEGASKNATIYLFTYLVVGIAVAYTPHLAFQRKLLMGVQVPICVLAGSGLAALTARLPGDFPRIAAFFAVLLTAPSNVLFALADLDRLSQNAATTSHRPYLKQTEIKALDFLRTNARPTDAVLVSPDASAQNRYPGLPLTPYLSVYIPALTGRTVFDGHWSETAKYGLKLAAAQQFFRDDTPEQFQQAFVKAKLYSLLPDFRGSTPEEFRQALIRSVGIRYILCDNRLLQGTPPRTANGVAIGDLNGLDYVPVAWAKAGPPAYLKTVFHNADVTIYEADHESEEMLH